MKNKQEHYIKLFQNGVLSWLDIWEVFGDSTESLIGSYNDYLMKYPGGPIGRLQDVSIFGLHSMNKECNIDVRAALREVGMIAQYMNEQGYSLPSFSA